MEATLQFIIPTRRLLGITGLNPSPRNGLPALITNAALLSNSNRLGKSCSAGNTSDKSLFDKCTMYLSVIVAISLGSATSYLNAEYVGGCVTNGQIFINVVAYQSLTVTTISVAIEFIVRCHRVIVSVNGNRKNGIYAG